MSRRRDEQEPEAIAAPPEPVVAGREPVPFRRLPVPDEGEASESDDRVA